ncbi:MAG: hypothetical protein IJH47_09360 [Oscillospiraceae bacterium]|nr:hypothetical protein [Oscillospiraceae bacterium]
MRMEVLFIVHFLRDNTDRKRERQIVFEEEKTMGDVMVILALALYIPMSMVFVLCRR